MQGYRETQGGHLLRGVNEVDHQGPNAEHKHQHHLQREEEEEDKRDEIHAEHFFLSFFFFYRRANSEVQMY